MSIISFRPARHDCGCPLTNSLHLLASIFLVGVISSVRHCFRVHIDALMPLIYIKYSWYVFSATKDNIFRRGIWLSFSRSPMLAWRVLLNSPTLRMQKGPRRSHLRRCAVLTCHDVVQVQSPTAERWSPVASTDY